MRVTNSDQYEDIFFVATENYLGNKASAYNQGLNVTVSHHIPGPQPSGFVVEYLNSTQGDLILQGRNTDFRLVTHLLESPTDTPTLYEVRVASVE